MRLRKVWIQAIAMASFGALLLGAPTASFAGGESSAGGADDYRITQAFFRSYDHQNPVTACIEVIEGFGIARETLTQMIQSSFEQWSSYLREKRLTLVPSGQRIWTKLEFRPECRGDENLVVYFGVEAEEVKHYRSQFSKPFGFAQLTREADWQKPGRGFIWIAPPGGVLPKNNIPEWSPRTQDALAALVLHELGHVFGNGHVDGTCMTEKIGQYLEDDTSPAVTSGRHVALYSTIDSQIELVPCMECKMAYTAAETFDPIQVPGQDPASDWNRAFQKLTGRAPVAPVTIRYERQGSPQGAGVLSISDATESHTFPVRIVSAIAERKDSTPLFAGQGGISFYSFGISYFGRIKTLLGTELEVAVNYNMDGKKAVILPLGDGFYPRPIFVSAN